uniref:RING-type domain-containing protein n=1 Tax=Ciona savignyi TaxID=51511 RepID=H2YA30_CIOSA
MNQEDRENELLALESILDSATFKFNDSTGRLDIFPQLSISPIKIHVDLNCGTGNDDFPNGELRGVNFLPPYELNFSLPENYPASESPKFNLSCMWLSTSQLNKLCRKLDEIWNRNTGNVILYDWYQFLQEESLDFLGITDILHLRNEFPSATNDSRINGASVKSQSRNEFRRAIQTTLNYAEILPMLLKYDREKCRENFITAIFACNICFEDKKGMDCLQFKDCGHVYCKKCISSYFEIHITEGAISSLICPEPECKTTALPNQVKDAVKQHLYDRYEK